MKRFLAWLSALWDRIEAWFDPARETHLDLETRFDEMKGPPILPPDDQKREVRE